MTFYAFGLHHGTAPVAVREAFALTADAKRALYAELTDALEADLLVLSTCNRTEVYLYGTPDDVVVVREALARRAGEAWPEAHAFEYSDEAALRHIFEVAAGIRSLVPGDNQILGQVKDAYRLAVDCGAAATVLHRLMHSAFHAAKRVARETPLGSGGASISGAAVAAATAWSEARGATRLEGRRALVLGAGKMAELATLALSDAGADVRVANRTAARAEALAARVGARALPWDARRAAISASDIVLVAVSAPEPVLGPDDLLARDASPLLVLDIGVPRNVDAAVADARGVELIDLDALAVLREQAVDRRRDAIPAARAICEAVLAEFTSWYFHQQALEPAIAAIRDTFERVRAGEVARHHTQFGEHDVEALDRLTRSIVQKLLAIPIVRLKSVEPDRVDFVHGIRLMHALFTPSADDTPLPGAGIPGVPPQVVRTVSESEDDGCPFDHSAAERPDAEAARSLGSHRLSLALLRQLKEPS